MKNAHTPENPGKDQKDFQNENTDRKNTDPKNSGTDKNPYDSENLDQETGRKSKDITEKDIEIDLIENAPSEGFEIDADTQNSSEAQSGSFETIQPDKDNPVNKEFEIGQLGNEELKEDELIRDESGSGAPGHEKPSQRKF